VRPAAAFRDRRKRTCAVSIPLWEGAPACRCSLSCYYTYPALLPSRQRCRMPARGLILALLLAPHAAVAAETWWSLRPLARPGVPAVRDGNWARNPIDVFVLAGLEKRGLRPSPEADRRALIRRLSFDLVGLPPAPEEVEAFVAD